MGFFFNVLEMSINNTGLYITEKCENTFIYYLSDYVKKTCKTKKKRRWNFNSNPTVTSISFCIFIEDLIFLALLYCQNHMVCKLSALEHNPKVKIIL